MECKWQKRHKWANHGKPAMSNDPSEASGVKRGGNVASGQVDGGQDARRVICKTNTCIRICRSGMKTQDPRVCIRSISVHAILRVATVQKNVSDTDEESRQPWN